MVAADQPRVHTAALLAGAGVLVAATVGWWFAAAPDALPRQTATDFSAAETSAAEPGGPSALDVVERLLPESQGVIRRESNVLAEGGEIRFDVTTAQDVYRVQVVCVGAGDLEVTVASEGGRDSQMLPCSEEVQNHVFSPVVESFWVIVGRSAADPVPVAAQLVTH
jgi:hypothetical protein